MSSLDAEAVGRSRSGERTKQASNWASRGANRAERDTQGSNGTARPLFLRPMTGSITDARPMYRKVGALPGAGSSRGRKPQGGSPLPERAVGVGGLCLQDPPEIATHSVHSLANIAGSPGIKIPVSSRGDLLSVRRGTTADRGVVGGTPLAPCTLRKNPLARPGRHEKDGAPATH